MIDIKKQLIGDQFFGAPGAEIKLGSELANQMVAIKCNYKFSRDGGAVGAIKLKDHNGDVVKVPNGFLIWDAVVLVKTQVTSGGAATLALGANTTNDIDAAEAVATYAANAKIAMIPVGTAASAVLVTAEREITLTVASFALTAGEFDLFLIGMYQER